jgi:hypothetical protein
MAADATATASFGRGLAGAHGGKLAGFVAKFVAKDPQMLAVLDLSGDH